jgi:hypothetical protein
MKYIRWKQALITLIAGLAIWGSASAQFLDDFNGTAIPEDPRGLNGWAFFTGEGKATMELRQMNGYASILVDASRDRRNVWWALIKHKVSGEMDLGRLQEPGFELRIEARIRVSHAPRRVNLHLNTQKTTDFHSHLMEFDIPDTENWHTISMTTHDFPAEPGDTVFGQLALMDWGLERYRVDLDYFKVDVVNAATAGPDDGAAVPYHPPVSDPGTFAEEIKVAQDGMIDLENPDVNFNDWRVREGTAGINLLTASGVQIVILRWDLRAYAGKKVAGSGLLELRTHSVERKSAELPDFGLARVGEILGGDPGWDQEKVTCNSLCRGQPLDRVLNPQMIIDWPVTEGDGGKTYFTISEPVLQRLIDGKTLGIAVRSLGALNASFYSLENAAGKFSARLRFNLRQEKRRQENGGK